MNKQYPKDPEVMRRMVNAMLTEPGEEPKQVAKPKTDQQQRNAMVDALLDRDKQPEPGEGRAGISRMTASLLDQDHAQEPAQQDQPKVREYMAGAISFLAGRYEDGTKISRAKFPDGRTRATITYPNGRTTVIEPGATNED